MGSCISTLPFILIYYNTSYNTSYNNGKIKQIKISYNNIKLKQLYIDKNESK